MEDYAWDILSKGNTEFVCPNPECKMIWPNDIVKHVACLSIRKRKEFDQKFSENSMEKNPAFQKCPKCFKWVRRHDPSNNRVDCPIWNKAHWFGFTFCWVCLREWKRFRAGIDCGNPDCNDLQKKIKILAECPEKEVARRMCPSVRGCPNCGTLIEFIDQCNQMQCIGCKHYFCFICISHTSPVLDGTICRSYSTTCQVAERQTSLPIRWIFMW